MSTTVLVRKTCKLPSVAFTLCCKGSKANSRFYSSVNYVKRNFALFPLELLASPAYQIALIREERPDAFSGRSGDFNNVFDGSKDIKEIREEMIRREQRLYRTMGTRRNFTKKALQAIEFVSERIYEGDLDSLKGLLEEEAFDLLQERYQTLTDAEKNFILSKKGISASKTVCPILHTDDSSEDYRVEVQVLFMMAFSFKVKTISKERAISLRGAYENCTGVAEYRFQRTVSKDYMSDWTIQKFNHYSVFLIPSIAKLANRFLGD